ncbi:MAG: hypothetical protein J6C28_07035 [Bacilli bacterium]|nr:hypothetical protein [Bacilli bacterium]
MQFLFLLLFGGVVSFILYLSYDRHVSNKKKVNEDDELKIDLNKYSDLIETEKSVGTETLEKDEIVEEEVVEVTKFKARRNK